MDLKLQEKLNRIADLEREGYSLSMIASIEYAIENPNAEDDMRFSTIEEYWEWHTRHTNLEINIGENKYGL